MPNPLIKSGPANTSKDVPDRLGLRPAIEGYPGDVFPYRGTEDHGVTATDKPTQPGDWQTGRDVEYMERPVEQDPIPVRIVEEGSRELRRFRVFVGYAGGTTNNMPKQIVGQDEERSTVRISNTSTDKTVWISHSAEQASSVYGYPISAGEELVLYTHMAIYAMSDNASDLGVRVLVEYSTAI